MNFERAWSLVDPNPVLFEQDEEILVAWNGFIIPHELAVYLVFNRNGFFFPEAVRVSINEKYNQLLKAYSIDEILPKNVTTNRNVISGMEFWGMYDTISVLSIHVKSWASDKSPNSLVNYLMKDRIMRQYEQVELCSTN